MSLLATLETDFEDVKAKVEAFATDHLAPALAEAATETEKLQGNPVVQALLSAVHVPDDAFGMVIGVINKLEDLYKPETDTPSPADPVVPADSVPAAAPAEPVVAADN